MIFAQQLKLLRSFNLLQVKVNDRKRSGNVIVGQAGKQACRFVDVVIYVAFTYVEMYGDELPHCNEYVS